MAIPTNQVKKETTTHPQTRLAGPAYERLEPYSGVIPVNSVIVENDIASVLNNVCNQNLRSKLLLYDHKKKEQPSYIWGKILLRFIKKKKKRKKEEEI